MLGLRPALSIAIRTESTRLIWPAPMPAVASPCAITIAFERTCLQTAHGEHQLAPLLPRSASAS